MVLEVTNFKIYFIFGKFLFSPVFKLVLIVNCCEMHFLSLFMTLN